MRLSTLLSVVLALLLLGLWTPTVLGDTATDEQTATGTVKSVSEKQHVFVLTIKDKDQTFRVSDSAKIRIGDKDAKFADLKQGDKVTVTYRMQARAIRSAKGTHMRGQLKGLALDKSLVILKDANGKEHTFMLDKETKVRLADKDAKTADLKLGDEVVIGWEKSGTQMMARQIRCHRGEHAARIALGEVKKVGTEKNELVLKDASGNERCFHLAKDAKVRLEDKDSKLADLKQGDKVAVTYARMVTDLRANRRD